MRALLIDAAAREIRAVEYEGLRDMQTLLGGYLEVAKQWSNGDVLYVDEEGKLKRNLFGFLLPDRRDIYAGNGLVVGPEVGDTAETKPPGLTVAMLRDMIQWISFSGVAGGAP